MKAIIVMFDSLNRRCLPLLLLSFLMAACTSHTGWTQLFPSSSPPALGLAGVAYAQKSGQAVVFGGITKTTWSDETWIWTGDIWRKAAPATHPPAREKLAMAYDEARDRVVLFGGRDATSVFADTWEWDGATWQQLQPAHHPSARCCHAMAYDEVSQRVFLSGGWNEKTGQFSADVWAWDGSDWHEQPAPGLPANAAHMLVTSPAEEKLISIPSTDLMNTYEWNGKGWQEIPAFPAPARADARSAYDARNRRILLFGGIAKGKDFLDDTWLYAAQTWVQVKVPSGPLARYAPVLFYDLKRQNIILFGGVGPNGVLRDTWELNLPGDVSALMLDPTPTP
jgi:hypothetical protein